MLSYLGRRLAVGIATAGLNNFFVILNRQVEHVADHFDHYDQALAYVLVHNGQSNKVFPSDEQLQTAFKTRDYYQHAKPALWFILDELNRARGEDQDIYSKAADGQFSIEHIMPQTMSKAWQQALGDQASEIHDHWVDRLPNLTLTGFNSKMSNRSFTEKRDMKDGYRDTAIKLNQWLTQYDQWNEVTLKEREEDLYSRALQVWPMPDVMDVDVETQHNDDIELGDDMDVTGWKIDSYSFLDVVDESVSSWSQLTERIVDQLWAQDSSRFYQAASDPNETLVTYTKEGDSRDQYEPLPDPEIQILTRRINNQRRLGLLGRLIALYQYSLSDIKVHQTNGDRLLFTKAQRELIARDLIIGLNSLKSGYPITLVSNVGGSTYVRFRTQNIDHYFDQVFSFDDKDLRAWSNGSPYYWEFQLKNSKGVILRLVTHLTDDDSALHGAIDRLLDDYDTPRTQGKGWRTVKESWQLPLQAADLDLGDPEHNQILITQQLKELITEITQ
ncbi:MAG: HNH endonuclease family protein [Lactobacillus sp.]|nr:HNH endonuclease family protein [Lactobacillus sp.]MCI1942171.1 HNH endonuclease family protein [Lactobacillus sp.]MCI1972555.1 HNH endonuclease family protein [Lactobacillus sp.]